jgi:hypothetical protein
MRAPRGRDRAGCTPDGAQHCTHIPRRPALGVCRGAGRSRLTPVGRACCIPLGSPILARVRS